MNKGLNISALTGPVVFAVEGFGEVAVQARQTGFHLWLEKGRACGRWPEGAALLRDLLAERAASLDGAKLDAAAVAALTPEALEAAAGAFLHAPDPVRGAIGTGEESTQRPGESEIERLRRVLFARANAASAPLRRLTEEIDRPARLMRQALGPAHAMLEQQRKLDQLLRPARELEALHRSVYGPGSVYETIRAAEEARRATFSNLADLLPAATAMSRMHDHVLKTSRMLEVGQSFAQLANLSGLTRPVGLSSRAFEDALGLSKLLRSQFDFRTPALALASLGAAHAAEFGIAQSLAASLMRPGFQATVVAALDGFAARGAASDVLGHYGTEIDSDAPVFAAVVEGVTALDEDDAQGGSQRLEAAMAQVLELLAETRRKQNRPLDLMGVIAIVGVLAAVGSLFFDFASWRAGEVERKAPPESAAIVAKLDELKAAAQPDLKAQRDVRYVHERAWLRAEPRADALELRAVFPDQPVRVLEATDRWAKVEVYDYASDRPMTGWISRRRLRLTPLD